MIILLAFTLFSQQSWAPPIKGGATGGAAAADVSKCDLNPSKQTKVKVKGKDGKEHYICTGQAICGGKAVPVSCKVSEKEPCPTAKLCIQFQPEYFPKEIQCGSIKDSVHVSQAKSDIEIVDGDRCSDTGEHLICLTLKPSSRFNQVYAYTHIPWKNDSESSWHDDPVNDVTCFLIIKGQKSCHYCRRHGVTQYRQTRDDIKWATDKQSNL